MNALLFRKGLLTLAAGVTLGLSISSSAMAQEKTRSTVTEVVGLPRHAPFKFWKWFPTEFQKSFLKDYFAHTEHYKNFPSNKEFSIISYGVFAVSEDMYGILLSCGNQLFFYMGYDQDEKSNHTLREIPPSIADVQNALNYLRGKPIQHHRTGRVNLTDRL